jgi:hypothetical protein
VGGSDAEFHRPLWEERDERDPAAAFGYDCLAPLADRMGEMMSRHSTELLHQIDHFLEDVTNVMNQFLKDTARNGEK